jgi:hydroxyacyl-ACP dehydratase HTD2-like protein with hotdog domain
LLKILSIMEESVVQPPTKSNEICGLATVRRVAAMLDLDPQALSNGDVLPRGWHFFMLSGETRKSELRADGFPGLGVPIPDAKAASGWQNRVVQWRYFDWFGSGEDEFC